MANAATVQADDPERALALSYAVEGRAAAAAILALDDRLASILRATRDPLVGQMRLTWWHDALCALDEGVPPAEPVLEALARDAVPAGVRGRDLAEAILGWEALLDRPLAEAAIAQHGARGRAMFVAVSQAIGAADDAVAVAGEGWALADLSRHLTDARAAAAARDLARGPLDRALDRRWSRRGRMLGALAHLARIDLDRPDMPRGAPYRVMRLLRHRLTGR